MEAVRIAVGEKEGWPPRAITLSILDPAPVSDAELLVTSLGSAKKEEAQDGTGGLAEAEMAAVDVETSGTDASHENTLLSAIKATAVIVTGQKDISMSSDPDPLLPPSLKLEKEPPPPFPPASTILPGAAIS